MTPQPMIAVADVAASSAWYQRVLGFVSGHGGDEYEQLLADDLLVLQLHGWDTEEHPHLGNPVDPGRGNGVLLWFDEPDVERAYARAMAADPELLQPLELNPRAQHREFWLRDPDGYTVVVAGRYGDVGARPQDDPAVACTARVFAVQPEVVYAAFADPACLARWWGPAGFTSRFEQFDLRQGGDWRFTLHAPDGVVHPNHIRFVDVRPGRRVVLRHKPPHGFVLTLSFEAVAAGTRLGWLMRDDDAALLAGMREQVARANEQNLDRLAVELGFGPGPEGF